MRTTQLPVDRRRLVGPHGPELEREVPCFVAVAKCLGAIGACLARAAADSHAGSDRCRCMHSVGVIRIPAHSRAAVRARHQVQVVNSCLSHFRLHNTKMGQRLMVAEQVSIDDEWILT